MIEHRHFIIHKPYGYLSQFVNRQTKRKNKKLLGELYGFPKDIMAIGRLDEKSEGLLFLTTDGKLSERIRSNAFEKEYYVQLDGEISDEAIQILKQGVNISLGKGLSYMTMPCNAFVLNPIPNFEDRIKKVRDERHGPSSWISISIREGKFRQVRKMTAKVGFPTLRLIRIRIGIIELGQMEAGKVIELDEIELLNTE